MPFNKPLTRWVFSGLMVGLLAGTLRAEPKPSQGFQAVYDVDGEWAKGQQADAEKTDFSGQIQVLDLPEKTARRIVFIPHDGLCGDAPEVMRVLLLDEQDALQLDPMFQHLEGLCTWMAESALFTTVSPDTAAGSETIEFATSVAGRLAVVKATAKASQDEDGRAVIELGHPEEQVVESWRGERLTIKEFSQRFVFDGQTCLPLEAQVAYTLVPPTADDGLLKIDVTATRASGEPLERKQLVMTRRDLKTLAKVASKIAPPDSGPDEESLTAGQRLKTAKRWRAAIRSASKSLEHFGQDQHASLLISVVPSMQKHLERQMFLAEAAIGHAEFEAKMLGKAAPDFDLELLGGGRVRLSGHAKGKITLLSYWAVG